MDKYFCEPIKGDAGRSLKSREHRSTLKYVHFSADTLLPTLSTKVNVINLLPVTELAPWGMEAPAQVAAEFGGLCHC